MQREEAIARYNANPNYCKQCGKKIEIQGNQRPTDVRKKQFCNHSCSAVYNNHQRVKLKPVELVIEKPLKEIGGELNHITKGELFNKRSNYQSARSAIQKHARLVYFRNQEKRHCINCGYDLHVEVAHIKAVSDFDDNTLISEINSIENLIGLCPNCHWEYDHGLLHIQ